MRRGAGSRTKEYEGIHDDHGVALNLALHEAHDLDGAAGASVHDHLEDRERGDPGAVEVVQVAAQAAPTRWVCRRSGRRRFCSARPSRP